MPVYRVVRPCTSGVITARLRHPPRLALHQLCVCPQQLECRLTEVYDYTRKRDWTWVRRFTQTLLQKWCLNINSYCFTGRWGFVVVDGKRSDFHKSCSKSDSVGLGDDPLAALLCFRFCIVKPEDVSTECPKGTVLILCAHSSLRKNPADLCQTLRWSRSKLMTWLCDRLILHWEFGHCNCRQLLATFFRDWHPVDGCCNASGSGQ